MISRRATYFTVRNRSNNTKKRAAEIENLRKLKATYKITPDALY